MAVSPQLETGPYLLINRQIRGTMLLYILYKIFNWYSFAVMGGQRADRSVAATIHFQYLATDRCQRTA
jgi:hypothetical protein